MTCSRPIWLGGLSWDPTLVLLEDRLAGYHFQAHGVLYPELRTLAIEKFGPPAQVMTKQYRTGAGILVPGEVL
jgi:hypothetical protein